MYNTRGINIQVWISVFRILTVFVCLVQSVVVSTYSQSGSVTYIAFNRPHFLPPPPSVVNFSKNYGTRKKQEALGVDVLSERSVVLDAPKKATYKPKEPDQLFTPKVEDSQFYTYFEVNSYKVNLAFMDNQLQFSRMRELLSRLQSNPHVIIDSIVIYGSASPEGDMRRNEFLANARCNAVKRYIADNFLDIDTRKILTYSKGEDWSGLRNAIENDDNVPNKSDVLGILDISSSRENREYFLRRLGNGNSWRYISDNILPYLRSGVSSQVYYRDYPLTDQVLSQLKQPEKQEFVPKVNASTTLSQIAPKKMVNDTVFIYSKPDTIRIIEYVKDTIAVKTKSLPAANRPVWSVKTNLLYWAALQANIEAEFYFGRHWSLNFEYQVAWWKNASKHQYYQYTQCGPEGRYWFKGDGNFLGHYVGLHVGFGIYDLSWGNGPEYQGYQGEFAIALGLSYGYTWRIGKILHLEAGFGFGYIMTEYRRYRYIDQCYVYQGTERMQFLGPTKARLALQWRIGTGAMGGKKKKGGAL